jgi:hypothetical protein
MEELNIGLTEIAWNGGSHFWHNYNGLEYNRSVMACLEWLGIEETGFGLTGMAWNRGSWYWPDLKWLGMEEVSFDLTGIAWNGGSQY